MSADEQTTQRLQRWANRLAQAGLATPALMLLELSKPLGGIATHCAESVAPFLPHAGRNMLADLAQLLDDPATATSFAAALTPEHDPPDWRA